MSFDLQILFASDLEGGDTSKLGRAVNFAVLVTTSSRAFSLMLVMTVPHFVTAVS